MWVSVIPSQARNLGCYTAQSSVSENDRMTIESESDLRGLKEIGRIVGLTVHHMQQHVRPGMTTAELDAIGGEFLKKHGARSAPKISYNYPGYTCISLNDEAAHSIPGRRVIHAGDLVNIDVSAELDGYFADTGATMIVPPATPLKQKLVACARRARDKAVTAAQAGQRLNTIGAVAEAEARRCGFTTLRDLGGHGIGRYLHEAPRDVPGCVVLRPLPHLAEGLVITIEPFVTTRARHIVTDPDGWTLRTADGSLCAQFEHTIIVTRGHPIVLTAV